MAQSIYKVTQLYNEALEFVTSSPGNWMGFLESAGRNFGYPFQDQLLINYQRPEATAVLTFDQWTNQFGRRIRRGSNGIGVFGRSGTRTTVRYYRKIVGESAEDLLKHFRVAALVEDKINAMSVSELERLVWGVMRKELNTIINLGALIGLVLGLLNAAIR